jgi:hypothetical protein
MWVLRVSVNARLAHMQTIASRFQSPQTWRAVSGLLFAITLSNSEAKTVDANRANRTLCMAAMVARAATPSEPMMGQADAAIVAAPLKIVVAKQSVVVDFVHSAQLTLPKGKRSLIQIWQNDSRKLSFWLRFSDFDTGALCLWHNPFYGTISVIERSDPRCRCDKRR